MNREPALTVAAVIHHVVGDFLYQHKFRYAQFPELIDLAVVVAGLGVPRSNLELVQNGGSFWDTTRWLLLPRPFLDTQSLAYANAIAAWIRDEKDPTWASDLDAVVRKPMMKSLKYLVKTNDCFVDASSAANVIVERTQEDWLRDAKASSISQQVIALQHLDLSESCDRQRDLLVQKLQSRDRLVVLYAVAATQNLPAEPAIASDDAIMEELRMLIEHRDDEIRAKAMLSLARLIRPDDHTIGVATRMLDGGAKYLVFAGIVQLSGLDSVPDEVIPPANRALLRALQACDYEFVNLLASSFNRWLDDPKSHFEQLLADDSPDYYKIALEALEQNDDRVVSIE